jgi:choline dehydrogenase-like flavoprotein
MRPALAAGARLITGARVLCLEHDRTGRVTAAVVATESGTIRVRGARYVLAANGIGTPRLLLLSASATQPDGLGNRSGQLGRNLMLHPHARVDGRFDTPLGCWTPGQKAGLVCLEFLSARAEHDFPRGFKMQFSPAPMPTALPWGAGHHTAFHARFDRIAGLTICIEDLPEADNRITLSNTLTDRDGAPVARLRYRLSAASRRTLDFAMDRADEALRAAGASDLTRDPLKAQAGFHLMGTARMGKSPDDSVVNPDGRCHDAANLYLADASIFVTGSAMNPTSTAQALALRIADHIVRTTG